MKKFLFALAVICLSSSVMKAQDWAQFDKYASANDTVKVKPVAVFMGDSITEGWYRIYGNSSKGYWANAEGIMHHAAGNNKLRRAGYPCLMDYYVQLHRV